MIIMNKNTNIFDKDLNPVLEISTSEELAPLVEYIKNKLSESLTNKDAYKKYSPDHEKYADLIAAELRDFGGNTFKNIFRGEGPPWHEITCDVAAKLKAPYTKTQDISVIENSIIATMFGFAWKEMPEAERDKFLPLLGRSNKSAIKGPEFFQQILNKEGVESYRLAFILASQIAKSLLKKDIMPLSMGPVGATAAITSLTGSVVFLGPIAILLSMIADLSGPAYSITIPAVIHVAMLRKKHNAVFCKKCNTDLSYKNFKFCPECGEKLE